MTAPDLLPCPFCGGKPNLNPEFMREWQVECVCGVQAPPKKARLEAIAAWNRRAASEARVAEIRLAFENVDSQVKDEGEFTERAWEQLRSAITEANHG